MEKTVFQINDNVYFILNQKIKNGKIIDIKQSKSVYPILVETKDDGYFSFTNDGKLLEGDKKPNLSFTPYEIKYEGFSQERPLPDIKENTLIYVKLFNGGPWEMRYFSHFDKKGNCYVFLNQMKRLSNSLYDTISVSEYSLTNPLL